MKKFLVGTALVASMLSTSVFPAVASGINHTTLRIVDPYYPVPALSCTILVGGLASPQQMWNKSGLVDQCSILNSGLLRTSRSPQKNIKVFLVRFDRRMGNASEVVMELTKYGLAPATVEDLLALASQQPRMKTSPIVALGSSVSDVNGRYFPLIVQNGPDRELRLSDFWTGFEGYFLAIKK